MKNKSNYGKKITTKFIIKAITASVGYTLIYILIYIFARFLCSLIIWSPNSLLYQLLSGIGNNPVLLVLLWLIGLIMIIVICLQISFNYIDAIVEASELLVTEDNEWISLPEDLSDIEDRMNRVKIKAKRSLELAALQEQRKNDLIVYLAHDLKTPLTSMIGYLSLLDEIKDMPDSKREKYISIALEKSYKLEDLINELFEITRFNSEKIVLEKDELNLKLMLEQIIDDFYPILLEHDKEIKLNTVEPILLYGDPDKLARVFNNLIKNAIHYSTDKTITIDIKRQSKFVNIVVSNKGRKIPDEKLARIFEKFYRVDASRHTASGGSGLGLAIAKEIVELHDGTIQAKSTEDQTSFTVKLPFKNLRKS